MADVLYARNTHFVRLRKMIENPKFETVLISSLSDAILHFELTYCVRYNICN